MNFDINVLVADDMEGMRRILTNSLHQMGVKNVLTASHGAEALRMVQNHHVDVLISDWNMPVCTGLDLLRRVRGDAVLKAKPFVFLTATARDDASREQGLALGADAYLIRPIDPKLLLAELRRRLA